MNSTIRLSGFVFEDNRRASLTLDQHGCSTCVHYSIVVASSTDDSMTTVFASDDIAKANLVFDAIEAAYRAMSVEA
jgi:hypothetical protein